MQRIIVLNSKGDAARRQSPPIWPLTSRRVIVGWRYMTMTPRVPVWRGDHVVARSMPISIASMPLCMGRG